MSRKSKQVYKLCTTHIKKKGRQNWRRLSQLGGVEVEMGVCHTFIVFLLTSQRPGHHFLLKKINYILNSFQGRTWRPWLHILLKICDMRDLFTQIWSLCWKLKYCPALPISLRISRNIYVLWRKKVMINL